MMMMMMMTMEATELAWGSCCTSSSTTLVGGLEGPAACRRPTTSRVARIPLSCRRCLLLSVSKLADLSRGNRLDGMNRAGWLSKIPSKYIGTHEISTCQCSVVLGQPLGLAVLCMQ
jgi:hypothetical protein